MKVLLCKSVVLISALCAEDWYLNSCISALTVEHCSTVLCDEITELVKLVYFLRVRRA